MSMGHYCNRTLLIFLLFGAVIFSGNISGDCILNGKRLYGKVRVVSSMADFKVEVVSSGADLKVEQVKMFSDSCGKWEFVDMLSDFTVEFVNVNSDFKIEFVNMFPGVQ